MADRALAEVEKAGGDVAAAALGRANDLRSKHSVAMELVTPPPPEQVVMLAEQLAALPGAFKEARAAMAATVAALEATERESRAALQRLRLQSVDAVHFAPSVAKDFSPENLMPPKPSAREYLDDCQLVLRQNIAQASSFSQAIEGLFSHLVDTVVAFERLFPNEPASRAVTWSVARVTDFCEQDFIPLALPTAPGCRGNELTEEEWNALAIALSHALVTADKGADRGLALSFVLFRAIKPLLQNLLRDDSAGLSARLVEAAGTRRRQLLKD